MVQLKVHARVRSIWLTIAQLTTSREPLARWSYSGMNRARCGRPVRSLLPYFRDQVPASPRYTGRSGGIDKPMSRSSASHGRPPGRRRSPRQVGRLAVELPGAGAENRLLSPDQSCRGGSEPRTATNRGRVDREGQVARSRPLRASITPLTACRVAQGRRSLHAHPASQQAGRPRCQNAHQLPISRTTVRQPAAATPPAAYPPRVPRSCRSESPWQFHPGRGHCSVADAVLGNDENRAFRQSPTRKQTGQPPPTTRISVKMGDFLGMERAR